MRLPLYQVDAFTDTQFHGNPAAICPLTSWLDDELLQAIAEENNLSETAFFIPEGENFHIRWFTPVCEVDLCGHATLATGHVLFYHRGYAGSLITFSSRSGELKVRKSGERLILDFPVDHLSPVPAPPGLAEALGSAPLEVYRGKDDFLAVYARQEEIEEMRPDFARVEKIQARGVIVTAPGRSVDFVSRFFGPQSGIAEDPVTGSAHCALAPFWGARLGRVEMTGFQASARGGVVRVRLAGDRVILGGKAVTVLRGELLA